MATPLAAQRNAFNRHCGNCSSSRQKQQFALTYLPNWQTSDNLLPMEKRKPHCPLAVIHALVELGQVRATSTALSGAAAMDFEFDDMLNVIRALTPNDFYKSMTTHADHRVGKMFISLPPAQGMSISN